MRLLVATPSKRDDLYASAATSILCMDWQDPIDFLFVTGGDHDPIGWVNLCRKMNQIREVFLSDFYDALLVVESDIVVPPGAAKALCQVDADVVYGTFVLRHGGFAHWNTTLAMGPVGKMKLLTEDREEARSLWGQVIPCVGHGQACCLIRRNVLHTLGFRAEEPEKYAPDWYFSMDCQRLGFEAKAHLGVTCGHIHDNRIYWPTDEGELVLIQEIVDADADLRSGS